MSFIPMKKSQALGIFLPAILLFVVGVAREAEDHSPRRGNFWPGRREEAKLPDAMLNVLRRGLFNPSLPPLPFPVICGVVSLHLGFPGSSGREPTSQCRRFRSCRLSPWVEKIPWRRDWQPSPVFWPGAS